MLLVTVLTCFMIVCVSSPGVSLLHVKSYHELMHHVLKVHAMNLQRLVVLDLTITIGKAMSIVNEKALSTAVLL